MYLTQKNKIKQEEIKANIYDTTELVIDINGTSFENINEYINSDFTAIFPAINYSRESTELYEEELDAYVSRNKLEMSITSKKRLLEKETVLRYFSEEDTEQISICSLFVSIKLIYKQHPHKLSDKILLISKIMECLMKDDYLSIGRITLNKRDSVICATLYRLYQCLNKNLFGDIAYDLSRKYSEDVLEYYLRNDMIFEYKECLAYVSRTVKRGSYENTDAYQGIIQIDVNKDRISMDSVKLDCKHEISDSFEKLNEICYKIFIEHITNSFAEDLVKGKTNKVLGGFNKNEGI